MTTVMFNLAIGLSRKAQEEIIKRISDIPGVTGVGRLAPEIDDKDLSRMCYADVSNAGDPASVADRLERLDGVEEASVPAPRYLIP